ncbi:MAG: TRAP transporter large permease subunit [Betaproteobacteria bacterium]|nr:TRAP transporter large permease subunit [Betaproteobacteria bacterium]
MTMLLLFGIFAVLVILQIPIAFAMGIASFVVIGFTQPIPLSIVVQRIGSGLDSFVLLAIPLFVLSGHLLNRGGIADRIFEFAAAMAPASGACAKNPSGSRQDETWRQYAAATCCAALRAIVASGRRQASRFCARKCIRSWSRLDSPTIWSTPMQSRVLRPSVDKNSD